MSWLKRLFGGGSPGEPAPAKPTAEIEHGGFTIRAEPYRVEGDQYQTAGTILKQVGDETREYRFVRADRFATEADATATALQKGRLIVQEQGERMFGTL